jgi:transcriptional regulator with XRE-family HTH domain
MPNPTMKRDTYFLTKAERAFIIQYIMDNPNLTQEQIGDHFGVAKSTISNLKKESRDRAYFEKEILRLTNDLTKAADNIFKLQNEILRLKRK